MKTFICCFIFGLTIGLPYQGAIAQSDAPASVSKVKLFRFGIPGDSSVRKISGSTSSGEDEPGGAISSGATGITLLWPQSRLTAQWRVLSTNDTVISNRIAIGNFVLVPQSGAPLQVATADYLQLIGEQDENELEFRTTAAIAASITITGGELSKIQLDSNPLPVKQLGALVISPAVGYRSVLEYKFQVGEIENRMIAYFNADITVRWLEGTFFQNDSLLFQTLGTHARVFPGISLTAAASVNGIGGFINVTWLDDVTASAQVAGLTGPSLVLGARINENFLEFGK